MRLLLVCMVHCAAGKRKKVWGRTPRVFISDRTWVLSTRHDAFFLCVCTCPTKSKRCIFQSRKRQSMEFEWYWRKIGQLYPPGRCLPFSNMIETWNWKIEIKFNLFIKKEFVMLICKKGLVCRFYLFRKPRFWT